MQVVSMVPGQSGQFQLMVSLTELWPFTTEGVSLITSPGANHMLQATQHSQKKKKRKGYKEIQEDYAALVAWPRRK